MADILTASYEKNEVAVHTAERSLFWIWTVGIACIVIAFLFLAHLPRSVSVQIQKLTDGIKEITNANYSKRLNLGNEPEFKEIATLFNEMAERLAEYRNSSLEDILQGKKYIETIINSIAEPIIGLSKERKILFVNDEALTVLNLTRENIIDKPAPEVALKNDLLRRLIRQLVHPDDNKDPLCLIMGIHVFHQLIRDESLIPYIRVQRAIPIPRILTIRAYEKDTLLISDLR